MSKSTSTTGPPRRWRANSSLRGIKHMEMTAAATHFDAIVLGAGQAGPPLAVELANAGRKVALIERKDFGGTCVNTGCIPTKTLLANARVAHVARRAGDYGVSTGAVAVDMKKVKARKDE